MNQYFLTEIALKKGYIERKPALKELLKILFPHHTEKELWENPVECDKLNETIDVFLKNMLGKSTADLCIDYFISLYGDGSIRTDHSTIRQTIHEVVKHKEKIYKNIEERCKT
ncbi:MAG: hypothetical protein IJJ69_06085 [Oscillospiraceae bacterium]|nr:hypothetical protein [Oscillospiraceae bacterium]